MLSSSMKDTKTEKKTVNKPSFFIEVLHGKALTTNKNTAKIVVFPCTNIKGAGNSPAKEQMR